MNYFKDENLASAVASAIGKSASVVTDTDLQSLTSLRTLNLRGNYIDDYSPVSTYYNNLTTKDFSLADKNDAIFFVPNISNGILGTAGMRLSNTRGNYLYYSLEMYDSDTNELLSRKRGYKYVYKTALQTTLDIPEKICDTDDTYVVLKVYENDTYRHLMSETIIDSTALNLSSLN